MPLVTRNLAPMTPIMPKQAPMVYAFRLGAKIMMDVLTAGKMKEI